ncbi:MULTISPECIES: type III pantothenate kinase [Atopobiaceae]|uniref:Type III pantothenate kinase n=1 Tax=Parafannyhessea umbonata TaxID=604330 RepID=A0A1H6IPA4_9ACTN|nr:MULTISPECIES: type III pantothenate kinase [Atopobiaceae]SEH50938.1 type III pantothenate kinase [Parafannyhessea umbonata]SJZ75932.1 type III pantothenate kinase [Olsenella sp. KH1P3]
MTRPLCCLTVDVGNTTTRFGLFSSDGDKEAEPLGTWELTTPKALTSDEARMQVMQVLSVLAQDLEAARDAGHESRGFARPPLGAILSCVVPTLVAPWTQALASSCKTRPLVVGPGLKTGLRLCYNDPSEVGPDRIADALSARGRYGAPVVVIDLGTTANIEVVDARGAFAGGIIAPGMPLEARALAQTAARLPSIELKAPSSVIARSTRDAMCAGVVLGSAARIDGLLDRVFDELGQEAPVVLTGDDAAWVAALLAHRTTLDGALTLRGLHQIYLVNVSR